MPTSRTSSSYDAILKSLLEYVPGKDMYPSLMGRKDVCKVIVNLKTLKDWSVDPGFLRESKHVAENLKIAQNILTGHLKTLREDIEEIERSLRPFELGKGIANLPDELLLMIFERVEQCNRNNLHLVSTRFRRVALRLPRAWGISNATDNMQSLKDSLAKSGSSGLSVSLHLGESDGAFNPSVAKLDLMDVLRFAHPHHERWQMLGVFMGSEDGEDVEEVLDEMNRSLSGLTLPLLETLQIDCVPGFGFAEFLNDPERVLPVGFYSTCTMPRLREFSISNFIPSPFTSAPALTKIFIELTEDHIWLYDFNALAEFLGSVSTLEDLSLSMWCFDGSTLSDVAIQTLGRLKKLDFKVEIPLCKVLLPFRRALLTPAIEEMEFRIIDDALFPGIDWLTFVLCHESYPTLKELSISVLNDSPAEYTVPFMKVPSLRTLRLNTTHHSVQTPSRSATLPALHTIDIKYCDGNFGHYHFLKAIGEGTVGSLKKVIVRGEKRPQEDLKGMFSDQVVLCESSRAYISLS